MEQLGVAPDTMRRRVEETLDLLGIADLRSRDLRHPVRRRAAAGRHRLGAHHPPAPARARRADLGPRPDRRRGRAGHPDPARARPRPHRAARRAPARAGGAVRRPDRPAHRRRRACGSTSRPPSWPTSPVVPPDHRAGPRGGLVAAAAERARGPAPRAAACATCAAPAERAAPPAGEILLDAQRPRPSPTASTWPSRDVDVALRAGPRHRPDGPQRLRQVDPDLDPPGRPRAPLRLRSRSTAPTRRRLDAARRRAHVGLVPQTAADLLYLETVAEECAAADAGGRRGPGHLPRPARPARARASTPATTPATSPRASAWPWSLAIVLSTSPRVLLLDEPTRGLDYAAKRQLAAIVRDLADDGHAVLVATHDVEFVASVADDVVVLAEGEVVSDRPHPAGGGRVAVVRPAGHQDPRRARGCASTRSWRRWRRRESASSRAEVRRQAPPPADGPASAAVPVRRLRWLWRRPRVAGLMMLCWPLLLRVPEGGRVDPPFLFLALLPLVIVVVLAEFSEGGMDARVLAVLGVPQRGQRGAARARRRHRGHRAGLLPADPGRAGVRPGLRLRARLHVAVRERADDRGRGAVAALPDAALGVDRHGRRAAAAAAHAVAPRSPCWSSTASSRRTPSAS